MGGITSIAEVSTSVPEPQEYMPELPTHEPISLTLKRTIPEDVTMNAIVNQPIEREINHDALSMDVPSSPFDEVCILAEVSSALSSSNALSQILQVILTGATASQGVGFNRCFLFLYDEKQNELRGHMAVGPSSAEEAKQIWQQLSTTPISFGELLAERQKANEGQVDPITRRIEGMTISLVEHGLIRTICSEHTSINLEETTERDTATVTLLERLGTTSAAIIPMTVNSKLMGLLIADNLITGRKISDRDVRLLHMLANQAAVAMERAKLYESQLERVDELFLMNQLLADSQEQLVTTEKMSFVGELTTAVAGELKHPISVIEGFASILNHTALTDDQREYLRILHQETKRLESVVSRLGEFCNVSRLPYRNFDFNELIQELVNTNRGRDRRLETMISLTVCSESLPVMGNRAQLSMAIEQILKLIIDELPTPIHIELRTESVRQIATLYIRLTYQEQNAAMCGKSLQSMLTSRGNSVRLPALFAGETIRFHGGTVGCDILPNANVLLYFSLPLTHQIVSPTVHEVSA
jgi:signal transduction histidine kinase